MLVFATSDKGGTGRSVTTCNVAYRRSLHGTDVCYLDFDFGSPTAGAIFEVSNATTGIERGGLHDYLQDRASEPQRIDVWSASDRESLRTKPVGSGQLVLLPGSRGGGEFPTSDEVVRRCARLLVRLEEEFEICFVDLSAGRSHAVDMALAATSQPELSGVKQRWIVYHRWTRQHIAAASGLVYGERGILKTGVSYGHDEGYLRDSIRFVRTAVLDPGSPELSQIRPAQAAWLRECNKDLQQMASKHELGRLVMLGKTPLDPVLQWREQLISDADIAASRVANQETVLAFEEIAKRLTDDASWVGL